MNLPNKLTTLRLILVPIFFITAYFERNHDRYLISCIIYSVAAFTDFLDGYLARKYDMVTDFGKFSDPMADKVLVAAAMIFLLEVGKIPGWIVLVIVAREYAVSILRAIAAAQGKVIAAAKSGKIKTVTQMIGTIMMLLNLPFKNTVMFIAAIITLYSGFEYLYGNKEMIFKDM